jgi:large subunit ribosomal protein L17
MRHNRLGRQLSRTASHRKAMMRNLVTSLFEHERITTTLAKAKEGRRFAERLITTARAGDLPARRRVSSYVRSETIARKLMEEIAPRFKERPGGYTRIYRLGPRPGDNGEMAILELVEMGSKAKKKHGPDAKKSDKDKGAKEKSAKEKSAKEKSAKEKAAKAKGAKAKGAKAKKES